MADEKDQGAGDIKTDETSGKQSEETDKKTYTLEEAVEIATNTQKGISQLVGTYNNRMEQIETKLQEIVDKTNTQTGAQSGEDEYLTVGKLRQILSEQNQTEEAKRSQADSYIDSTVVQLRAEGVIKTDAEEEELIQYAINKKEPDLLKAAERWQEIKQAREEGKKESAKTKAKQEEGSQVGTSSTSGGEESKGLDYKKVQEIGREWGF